MELGKLTSVSRLFEDLFKFESPRVQFTCQTCRPLHEQAWGRNCSTAFYLLDKLWPDTIPLSESTTASWMSLIMKRKKKCAQCFEAERVRQVVTTPLFLWMDLSGVTFHIKIDRHLRLTSTAFSKEYSLAGIVYLGAKHYVCRFVDHFGMVWYHDGMNSAKCKECKMEKHLSLFTPEQLWATSMAPAPRAVAVLYIFNETSADNVCGQEAVVSPLEVLKFPPVNETVTLIAENHIPINGKSPSSAVDKREMANVLANLRQSTNHQLDQVLDQYRRDGDKKIPPKSQIRRKDKKISAILDALARSGHRSQQ